MTLPDVIFDANVLSPYLLSWRHWEMISDVLFDKSLYGASNISSLSVRHRLQCFEVGIWNLLLRLWKFFLKCRFFNLGARKFHFLKYKKHSAWKVTSWNIISFCGLCFLKYKDLFSGFRFPKYKKSLLSRKHNKYFGVSVLWSIRSFFKLGMKRFISQNIGSFF